jgi:hypothetical protein
MNCCQCQGIEELFNQQYVNKELSDYRVKGAAKTTRMLTEAIMSEGVSGLTLLDIGGGVGAVQHALIDAGVERVTSVDASNAYLNAAQEEARRRGIAERISYQHGNFADLAADISPADVVTLDRVICCYPDMEKLVGLSSARAGKIYGVVYPRDVWWIRLGLAIGNVFLRLRRNPFRTYSHATRSVEAIIGKNGLKRRYHRQTFVWQVAVFTR